MKRTQIYLTDEEERLLSREARRTGKTKAALIREAIDRVFGRTDTTRTRLKKALAASFGVWRSVPDDEIERLRSLRGWSERQRDLLAKGHRR